MSADGILALTGCAVACVLNGVAVLTALFGLCELDKGLVGSSELGALGSVEDELTVRRGVNELEDGTREDKPDEETVLTAGVLA